MSEKNIIPNDMTFEKAITRLEEIVSLLENGNAELDRSLELFEEGTALSGYCNKKLEEAQEKIDNFIVVEKKGERKADE